MSLGYDSVADTYAAANSSTRPASNPQGIVNKGLPVALTPTLVKGLKIFNSVYGVTPDSAKPFRSLPQRLSAAVKPTQINIKNNLANDILISPINSSVGRPNFLTNISNGVTKSIRDSNGGSGNYDLEFSIKVLAPGKPDELIGEFRADNPWLFSYYVEALTDGVHYGKSSENDPLLKKDIKDKYRTIYEKNEQRTDKGDTGLFGKADTSKMEIVQVPDSGYGLLFCTEAKNGAFDKSVPYIEVENLGDLNGAKTWNFTVQSWA